jgi:hypothetical protein
MAFSQGPDGGRNMRRAAIGLAVSVVLLIAMPAIAQTATIDISIAGVVDGSPGDVVRVHTETVPEGMVGWSCSGTATTGNDASEHIGSNFHLASGSSNASILNWEAVANSTTSMSGSLVLGPTITIDLELGEDGISSGGVAMVLSCSQPPPPETTTTTAPPVVTTTTAPPVVTTVTTPPPGDTATVPPPEGGVAAGGGGTAGDGLGALPWLAGGGLALLGAAALLGVGRRKASSGD